VAELKGKKIGMSPPGSATHAIATAILEQNFGIKSNEFSVAPGNEARLAQFKTQGEIDAAVIRSVTIAQMEDIRLRRLASVVDELKKAHPGKIRADPGRHDRVQRLSFQERAGRRQVHRGNA
jgi:NitT/TauT family transport system substrate-binding protein